MWVDSEEIASDDFVDKINEGLAGRDWLVLVMTPDSLASKWVKAEVNAAIDSAHKGLMRGVIPVVAKPCPEASIPPLWRTLHRYDAAVRYESAVGSLARALGLIVRKPDVTVLSTPMPLSDTPDLDAVKSRGRSRGAALPPKLYVWPLRIDFGEVVNDDTYEMELEV